MTDTGDLRTSLYYTQTAVVPLLPMVISSAAVIQRRAESTASRRGPRLTTPVTAYSISATRGARKSGGGRQASATTQESRPVARRCIAGFHQEFSDDLPDRRHLTNLADANVANRHY